MKLPCRSYRSPDVCLLQIRLHPPIDLARVFTTRSDHTEPIFNEHGMNDISDREASNGRQEVFLGRRLTESDTMSLPRPVPYYAIAKKPNTEMRFSSFLRMPCELPTSLTRPFPSRQIRLSREGRATRESLSELGLLSLFGDSNSRKIHWRIW
jgi:hypothetical protein